MIRRRSILVRLPLLSCATALLAAVVARPAGAATPEQVDQAIKKAKAYLYTQQKDDNWELIPKPNYDAKAGRASVSGWQWGGVTGTAVYGLLASGESAKDPRLEKALNFLYSADIHGHYATAMRAQAWHFLKDEKTAKAGSKIDYTILIKGVNTTGPSAGFYSYYTDTKGKIEAPWFDRSVSQICVLGMWACEQAGQEVDSAYWKLVDAAWKKSQKPDGGWSYKDDAAFNGGGNSSGTMTAAGIATLFITQDYLMQADSGRWSSCRGGERNEWIEKGLAWMDKNAPKLLAESGSGHYHYQLYGIERIGVASGRKYFGTTDWYAAGAEQLVKTQNKDGSWGKEEGTHNPKRVPDTVFAILFLTRGRAPVIMNKLEWEPVVEAGKKAPVIPDPWNQRPRDVANFAGWSSRISEQYLNWQVVNLKVSAAALHDAPILYLSGSIPLKFSPEEIEKLRDFVEGGGTILGNADCANAAFTKSFAELGTQLFPKYEMREIPKTHPIYTSEQFRPNRWKVQPKLMGVSNGARELMLLIPDADFGKSWQVRSEKTRVEAFELMQDIFLYAVDKEGLVARGVSHIVNRNAKVTADRNLAVARLQIGDNPNPEPGAWRRMSNLVHNDLKLDLKLENIKPGDGKLGGFKFAHLTGTTKFKLSAEMKSELKQFVDKGGTLMIDAAGGSNDFADSAEAELKELFGEMQVLPPEHPIYQEGGKKIEKFLYRPYVRGKISGELNVPRIKAFLAAGRPAVLYSREDITEGLLGQPVDGILGYTPDTATSVMKSVLSYVAGKSATPVATSDNKPAEAKPKPKADPKPKASAKKPEAK